MEVWWNVYLNASIIWRRTPFENIFNSKHGNHCFVTWNRFSQHYCVIDRKLANNYCISNKFWSWTCCCIPIKLKRKFNAVFISWGKINREFKNHDDDGNKKPTNLHIWQWKTDFLHALHVHLSYIDILKTFSFFLRREMTCFALVRTTWTNDDKCSILSSYVPSAGSKLISGQLEDIFQA